jgi:hypothetical protein
MPLKRDLFKGEIMKKSLAALATLALSLSAMAQETTTTPVNVTESSTSFYDTLKKGPIHFGGYIDLSSGSDGTRSTRIKSIGEIVSGTVRAKLTDKDSLSFATRFTGTTFTRKDIDAKGNQDKNSFRWERSVLGYKRSGLLQQANHGIDLSLGVESRLWGDNNRTRAQAYGHNRLVMGIDHKFNNLFSISMTNLAALYMGHANGKAYNPGSSKSYYGTYIAESFSFNDFYTMTFAQEYTYFNRRDKNTNQSLVLYFNHNFNINSAFNVDLYAQTSELFANNESGKEIKSSLNGNDWEKNLSAGVTFNFNAF